MAAPGYPQMGQMPPGMGGPPMAGPHGAMPMPPMRPIRRGVPKAVPVVVAAGLAVGVFCGLLFGVGTGKHEAVAAPSGNNVKKGSVDEPKPEPGAAPKGLGATSPQPSQPATPKAGTVAAAGTAGSGSAAAVASAGSAAQPAVEDKKGVKVTFKLKPDGVDKDAKISIDGKPIDGVETEIAGETKSFTVQIKANGYRSFEKKMDIVVEPGQDMQVQVELQKKPSGGSSGTHPIKRPDRPTNAGGNGGGLIDI